MLMTDNSSKYGHRIQAACDVIAGPFCAIDAASARQAYSHL